MTTKPTIYGWHFLHEGHKMRDGTTAPKDGQWLTVKNPKICARGLHGSRTPAQALNYAPGPILCLCEFSIPAEEHPNDKFVSASRRIIARFDATEMLRYYARMQALSVIRPWNAPDVVLDYLMTGNEAIRAAASTAAWDAARTAAWDAARDAMKDAAMDEFDSLVCECFEGPLAKIGLKP